MKHTGVQNWLNSSQQNITYDLDFYTPFKEMAMLPGSRGKCRSREVDPRPLSISSSSSLAQMTSPSSTLSPSSRIQRESSPPRHNRTSTRSHKPHGDYKKRARHKTKAGRYEYKGNKDRSRMKRQKSGIEKRHGKHRLSRAKLHHASDYHAPNVSKARLTIKGTDKFLKDGHASVPVKRPALPDLSFPETTFLNLRRRWAAENAQRKSLNRQLEKDRERRERRQIEEERKISNYFQHIPSDTSSGQAHEASRRIQNFVYETPCRQINQPDKPPPEAIVNLDQLERPFLGFGKPGPEVQYLSASTNARKNSYGKMPERHLSVSNSHQRRARSGRDGTNAPSSDSLSTPHSVDDRFRHSVTSNFRFARKQAKYHPAMRQYTNKTEGESVNEKQDKILKLLKNLQETQEKQLQQPQNSIGQTLATATAQTQTDLDKPDPNFVEKVNLLLQESENGLYDSSRILHNDKHCHTEQTNQEQGEFETHRSLENKELEAPPQFQPAFEHVERPGRQDHDLDLCNTASVGSASSPIGSSVEMPEHKKASSLQAHNAPIFGNELGGATSRSDVKSVRGLKNTTAKSIPLPLPTPMSLRMRQAPRSRRFPFYVGSSGPSLYDMLDTQTSHASYMEPLSARTWIRTSAHPQVTNPRRIGRTRETIDSDTDITTLRSQLDGQNEELSNLDQREYSQMVSAAFDDFATYGRYNEELNFDPVSDLPETSPPESNLSWSTADEEGLSQFWKPNLLYPLSEHRGHTWG